MLGQSAHPELRLISGTFLQYSSSYPHTVYIVQLPGVVTNEAGCL